MRRWRGTVVGAAVATLMAAPTTAWAGGAGHGGGGGPGEHGGHGGSGDAVETVASDLQGPRQMDRYGDDQLVVAESDSGEISSVDPGSGEVRTLFDLGPDGTVNPQGVGYRDGQFFIALGELGEGAVPPVTEAPDTAPRCETGPQLPPGPGLVVTEEDGTIVARCDLLSYELFANPDGQEHFGPDGAPLDSISNPYAVLVQDRRVLVADAGANAVWSIDRRTGEIEPFFVPPVVTTGECATRPNNTVDGSPSCDPTPTGIVEGWDGKYYVSGLSGLAQGQGRVYVVNRHGTLQRTIDGLNPLTGIAVDRRGTVYASELFGTTGADAVFADPTLPAGRVVQIERNGDRSYADVRLPQGLELADGSLYAAAGSLGPPPPAPPVGEVDRVGLGAFGPATAGS